MKQRKYAIKDREAIAKIRYIFEDATREGGPDVYSLLDEDRYAQYRHINKGICEFLDSFKIKYDKKVVERKLGIFSIWIKTADDEIDNGNRAVGGKILERLKNPSSNFDYETKEDVSLYLTELFKEQIDRGIYPDVMSSLTELYHSAISENNSRTMKEFFEKKKKTGKLISDVTFKIIEPELHGDLDHFRSFLRKVGASSNLVDCCLDLKEDKNNGLFVFKPTRLDAINLYLTTFREGLKVIVEYPFLFPKFSKHYFTNKRYLLKR